MTKAKSTQFKPAPTPPAAPKRTRSKTEQARVEWVTTKSTARADGPPMKLEMLDGVLQVNFKHADTDLAQFLMMADLGTCDPSFWEGIQGQVATIGAQGKSIDEGASNFLLSVVRGVQSLQFPSQTRLARLPDARRGRWRTNGPRQWGMAAWGA